ncbi:polysaccharide biosynthesis protein [Caballeronia sp. ATUFL_F1_KS39]|uniref:lipopolysaccharide biosynthesis protein n=1 Tax=Caballeronia sp. ATUFL_F1_KS39 TaxID=2921766 RepID=UPI002027E568|nr:polysaccharide biosynthesis protein [Caballeronia sp. ATUFL_F1_KS39]
MPPPLAASRRVLFAMSSRLFEMLPFGVGRSEGRDRDRYRRAALTIACNVCSSGLAFIVLIASVSWTLPYLGQQRFGVWMTFSSLAATLAMLDFGIGNALLNLVAGARANEDARRIRELITHGVWLLGTVGAICGICLYAALHIFDLRLVFGHSADAADETLVAATLFLVLTCLNIPLGGVKRVCHGLQRGWEQHIVSSIGYLISLPLLYWCCLRQASIPWLLFVTYGIQICMSSCLVVRLNRQGLLGLISGGAHSTMWTDSKKILSMGSLFFGLQVGVMCASGFDALIVAKLLGVTEVAKLAVAQRLFQFLTVGISMLTVPLWGLYADAKARGDTNFLSMTLKLSMLGTGAIATVTSGSIFAASSWLLSKWVGNHLSIPVALLCAVAVMSVVDAFGNAFGIFLNGVGELKSQLVAVCVSCALALSLKFWLVSTFHEVAWVVWSTVIASLVSDYCVYLFLFRKRIFAHLSVFDDKGATSA